MDMRKRRVHFYEIVMESYAHGSTGVANPVSATFDNMLQCFRQLKVSLPVEISRSANITTVLADWNHDRATGFYELLINKADATLSDVAFRHLRTKALRKAGKEKIEGIENSSHILLKPSPNGKSVTVLMTMGAGINIAEVAKLFRMLSKTASVKPAHRGLFYFAHPSGEKDENGKPVQYRVSYKFLDYAFRGQTLAQALQSGEFDSMELIAHETARFDSGGNLQIEERSLKIKAAIPKHVSGATLKNAIRHYMSQPDGKLFDTARIHYKSPSGKSSITTLPIQDLDAAFTHNEIITFDTDVEAQQGQLSQTVLQKMRPLLKALP